MADFTSGCEVGLQLTPSPAVWRRPRALAGVVTATSTWGSGALPAGNGRRKDRPGALLTLWPKEGGKGLGGLGGEGGAGP